MTPPRRSYLDARARTMVAVVAVAEGVVEIGGRDYRAAVTLDSEGYDQGDLGTRVVQRLRVSVSKRDLLDRPRRGMQVRCEGLAYEVELVSGDAPGDPHWGLVAFRTPGADE
jgi:hypothetical protein